MKTSCTLCMFQVDKHAVVAELGIHYRDLRILDPLVSTAPITMSTVFAHRSKSCATPCHQHSTQWHAAGSHPLPHSSFHSGQGSSGEPGKHPHDNFSRSG